ncbi:glutathione S-transferase [Shewanella glacialimarina]|jgi:glutathione S-transferase|uniref:glutathione S-transferase n=1 Tax=Shewanella glacialimarina TaxID=2590884 RepID=UPI001CF916B6|nr:glutathione S-transferase [Shewanella glacialimarina]UCX05754.1 glutathione S-transferase [Shewanella glacialimarina]
MSNITLYRHPLSGHAHRVEFFLSILGLKANIVDVDLMSGAQKKADFLAKNTFGQVPVLVDGDVTLSDSNAIIFYLAKKYDTTSTWLPENLVAAAEVQRFLSVAAGRVASGPAAARLITLFSAKMDPVSTISASHSILTLIDAHLNGKSWLVGDKPTIADIANYTYIAHAPEGNVSLDNYPHINAWLARIEALAGFVPMVTSAVGLRA